MDPPTLVYDDDCGFCTWWADFFEERSDVRLVGFSELDDEPDGLRERLPTDYATCSHLVTDDGVYSCGASIEEALVRAEICWGVDLEGVIGFFRTFEDYNRLREACYRWVAGRRRLWGRVLSATSEDRDSDDRSPPDGRDRSGPPGNPD